MWRPALRAGLPWVVGVGLWSAVAGAASFPQNPHIAAAQAALNAGDADRADAELQAALRQPANGDDALAEIYKLQGFAALYQGDPARAKASLEKLYQVRPDYELPRRTSPKIRAIFAEVQSEVRARRVHPVSLDFAPPTQLTAGGPVRLQASARDLPASARMRLFYRRAGSEAFQHAEFQRQSGDLFAVTLAAAELPMDAAPFALECFVEVDDAAGRRLTSRGDPLSPLVVKVRAPETVSLPEPIPPAMSEAPRWYERWYVWTAVGALAVGGAAVGMYLATRPTVGTLPVTVTIQ